MRSPRGASATNDATSTPAFSSHRHENSTSDDDMEEDENASSASNRIVLALNHVNGMLGAAYFSQHIIYKLEEDMPDSTMTLPPTGCEI